MQYPCQQHLLYAAKKLIIKDMEFMYKNNIIKRHLVHTFGNSKALIAEAKVPSGFLEIL